MKPHACHTPFMAAVIAALVASPALAWTAGSSTFAAYSGSFTEGVICSGTEMYWAKSTFKFAAAAVSTISDYNNGGNNPGTRCDNVSAYMTLDMTALGDGWGEELDVYSTSFIYTNLPSPKADTDDDKLDGEHEEAEVTALGTLTAEKNYYVIVYWWDYRDGDSTDGGVIEVSIDISKKSILEYNVCQPGDGPQESNAYGDDLCDT